MNIICIGECYNHRNDRYLLNGVYRYDESDIVPGLDLRYYNIYTREGERYGVGNKAFIEKHFITLYEYNKVMHEVDKIYDMWFNK